MWSFAKKGGFLFCRAFTSWAIVAKLFIVADLGMLSLSSWLCGSESSSSCLCLIPIKHREHLAFEQRLRHLCDLALQRVFHRTLYHFSLPAALMALGNSIPLLRALFSDYELPHKSNLFCVWSITLMYTAYSYVSHHYIKIIIYSSQTNLKSSEKLQKK